MRRAVTCCCLWVCLIVVVNGRLNVSEGEVCREENGEKWFCKSLGDCQYPYEFLNDERNEPPFCQFEGSDPIVCCDPAFAVGKTNEVCKKYAESVYIKTDSIELTSCTVDSNIFKNQSATVTSIRKYPHMALLGYGEEQSIEWLCGANLISDSFLISAAHCKHEDRIPKWVLLGDYRSKSDLHNIEGSAKPVVYRIDKIIVHPGYKASEMYDDIALYKLNTSVQFDEYVRPVCLQKGHVVSQQYVTEVGWSVADSGKLSEKMEEVSLTEVKRSKCKEEYQKVADRRLLPDGIREDSMFCASYNGHGCWRHTDALFQVSKDTFCMSKLVATLAYPRATCKESLPAVYTRISHYIPWIESIVWP